MPLFWWTKTPEKKQEEQNEEGKQGSKDGDEQEDEEEDDDDYYKSPPCPPEATPDALRRRTLMMTRKGLRKLQTTHTYHQQFKMWKEYCSAPAGTTLDGVLMPESKEVMDTMVTAAKAEEYIVEFVAKRNKRSGGVGKLCESTIEKTLCGVMDIMRFQIADDYLEATFPCDEFSWDSPSALRTPNVKLALSIARGRNSTDDLAVDRTKSLWESSGYTDSEYVKMSRFGIVEDADHFKDYNDFKGPLVHCLIVLGHSMLLRGDSIRNITFGDFYCDEAPLGRGQEMCPLLAIQTAQKTENGKRPGWSIPHKDPLRCPLFAIGLLIYVKYCVYGSNYKEPDYSSNKWKNTPLFPGVKPDLERKRGVTIGWNQRSDDTHLNYEHHCAMVAKVICDSISPHRSQKVTHLFRQSSAQEGLLNCPGGRESIETAANWTPSRSSKTAADSYYKTGLDYDWLLHVAGVLKGHYGDARLGDEDDDEALLSFVRLIVPDLVQAVEGEERKMEKYIGMSKKERKEADTEGTAPDNNLLFSGRAIILCVEVRYFAQLLDLGIFDLFMIDLIDYERFAVVVSPHVCSFVRSSSSSAGPRSCGATSPAARICSQWVLSKTAAGTRS